LSLKFLFHLLQTESSGLFKITLSYGSVNVKSSDRNSLSWDWSMAQHFLVDDDTTAEVTGTQIFSWSGNRTH